VTSIIYYWISIPYTSYRNTITSKKFKYLFNVNDVAENMTVLLVVVDFVPVAVPIPEIGQKGHKKPPFLKRGP